MEFDEAMKATVSQEEARRELARHGFTFEEFARDKGTKPFYKGKTVLVWLGY